MSPRPAPSVEFQLVAACCARPLSEERFAQIRDLTLAIRNWDRFKRVAAVHRVPGLLNEALGRTQASIPASVKQHLVEQATSVAQRSLRSAAEAVRLRRLFEDAAIPVLFLKGVTLAVLAYGDPGLRDAKDIDLFIAPEHVDVATALLEQAGYRRHDPPPALSKAQVTSLLPLRKDLSFVSGAQEIELHSRLLDNPHMMGAISVATSSRDVAIAPGVALRTLRDEDLFAYLCAHGANHCWYRLKWLADIGALLGNASEPEIERLYRSAADRGVEPAAAQAFLLCVRLFGTPISEALLLRLKRSRRARWLERVGLWALTTGKEEAVPPAVPWGATGITLSHYLLGSGWGYWMRELQIQLTSTRDMLMVPLPRRLMFLYPVLRLPLWICRRVMGQAH